MSVLLITLAIGAALTLLAVVIAVWTRAGSGPDVPDEEPEPPRPERSNLERRGPERALRDAKAAPSPMVVTEMDTRGFLSIEDASGKREEPLPASPLGHGEFPMAVWVSPEHTVYAVGKLYTGRPGPDEGVVWRRTREGAWSIAHRAPPPGAIGDVTGRSDDEVVGGKMGGIVCFDGQSWSEQSLPYAMMWKVWSEGGEIVAQAFDGSVAFTVSRGLTSMTHTRAEPRRDRYSFVRDGITYRVFDRSTPRGQRVLDPREEAEIRRELAQVEAALRR